MIQFKMKTITQLNRKRNFLKDKLYAYQLKRTVETQKENYTNFDFYSNIILDTLADIKEIDEELKIIR